MKRTHLLRYFLISTSAALAISAQIPTPPVCSTESVNHTSCSVQIDRRYPVTPPTIQMKRGKEVTVIVINPLPFETLSLDLQSAQAVAGTDQTAGILTAALAQAKGLTIAANLYSVADQNNDPNLKALLASGSPDAKMNGLAVKFNAFAEHAIHVYTELQEIVGTIPPGAFSRPINPPARLSESPLVKENTPLPWDYDNWKRWMLCEIGGCDKDTKEKPKVRGLLREAFELTNDRALATCPGSWETTKDTDIPQGEIYKNILDCYFKKLAKDNPGGLTSANQAKYAKYSRLLADTAVLANIVKDLDNYYVNIEQLEDQSAKLPVTNCPDDQQNLKCIFAGDITDPAPSAPKASIIGKLLGRQVVYTLNAVNDVGTFIASVPTAAQKKATATVTVLYADPILEASAGVFFSTLPNRSFANQTNLTPGAAPATESVVIAQTISRPTTVPFAAANWRLGRDFLVGPRRGAFYATAAIGINPNNTDPEFAAGLSFSWRSLMFSALYHEGRDIRLTQGQTVGSVWCSPTTTACGGAPPAPATERYWTGAFAIGISVRVPSVFGSGGSPSSTSSTGASGASTTSTTGH